MTSQASSTTNAPFFNTPTPPTPVQNNPPQQQGYFSSFMSRASSLVFSPVRATTAEAAQGAADRFSEIFDAHQPEITNRVRSIFTSALLQRTPENYHNLLHHIRAFLRNPSQVDLDQIKDLLAELRDDQIIALAPQITTSGTEALMSLAPNLEVGVIENVVPDALPTLTITDDLKGRLENAEFVLNAIIENHEGVLIQTLNTMTQSINASDGPLKALRDQLNHPQTGILSESFRLLRNQLTARAAPELREAKSSFDAYRNDATAHMQTLHAKIAGLLGQRALVPQINPDGWTQIEQFDLILQGRIANPSTLPESAQLLAESEAVHKIVTTAFTAQRGMVEEAADILVEGIGRSVEQLPGRLMQGIGSATAHPTAPTQPTGGTDTTVGTIQAQGSALLHTLLSSAESAMTKQAARSLATLVNWAFGKIRERANRDHPQLLPTIDPMILRLKGAIDTSSWTELTGTLESAFDFMQQQQVYLQGIRLPLNPVRHHESAIPNFLNNINAHQNALHLSIPPPQRVTEAMIEEQSNFLKTRSASYGPARFVAETICGIEGTPEFYADIYRPAADGDMSALFRERLFAKIDDSDVGFFTRWTAKALYTVIHPFSSFYLNSMIGSVLDSAMLWVKAEPSSQDPKDEMIIKLMRNWMAVTSGAYNQVASTPASQTRDFQVMMEEVLKDPARNGGLTQQELYAAVGQTLLNTFGPQIRWTQAIDNYFTAEIPSDSQLRFFNPVLQGLNTFCGLCLKAVVFIPQWVGNQVLQRGAKFALSRTPLLKEQSEKTIESLRRNTPSSYAMHKLIFLKQQKILSVIQQGLNSPGRSALPVRNTNIKKLELKGLVEYALEILNKSQYRTQDRLHNYLNHYAPLRDRAAHELEDTFLPEIMESVIATISIALQTMTEEEEMLEMVYNGLTIANDSFNVPQPVSEEEFAALEDAIQKQTNEILEAALFHAIDEKFDFMNQKQKSALAEFMNGLKDQTQTFSTLLGPSAEQIALRMPITAPDLKDKIGSMIEASSKFNKERLDALGAADGNRNFHTETKHHLNELSRELLNRCTPLANRLNEMKKQADEMVFCDKLLQPILLSHQAQRRLSETVQNPRLSADNIDVCKEQLLILKKHFETLRANRCPQALLDDLLSRQQECSAALEAVATLEKTEEILQRAQAQFLNLRQRKIASPANPPSAELKSLEKQLCALLDTLPFADQKNRLKELVHSLMAVTQTDAALSAAARFSSAYIEISAGNLSANHRYMHVLRQAQEPFHNKFNQAIHEYTELYAQNQASIQNHARTLHTESATLNTWAQSQHEQPIWDLFIFDMDWVEGIAKDLAFERASDKMSKLMEALYQKHNYIGFVNQVALLPFLKHFGAHHLKQA